MTPCLTKLALLWTGGQRRDLHSLLQTEIPLWFWLALLCIPQHWDSSPHRQVASCSDCCFQVPSTSWAKNTQDLIYPEYRMVLIILNNATQRSKYISCIGIPSKFLSGSPWGKSFIFTRWSHHVSKIYSYCHRWEKVYSRGKEQTLLSKSDLKRVFSKNIFLNTALDILHTTFTQLTELHNR